MRPAPERLALETYPIKIDVEPRFGDMDALHHLNNVALAQIYEEARLRFTATFNHHPVGDRHGRPMLAEVTIRYLAEGQYPTPIMVGVGVTHIGRSSYIIGEALFQNERCIGISDCVVVWTSQSRPAPIPDDFRTALEAARIAIATPAVT